MKTKIDGKDHPYSRQDRPSPFSLKIFAELLNTQNFQSVMTYDCHSDVGPALIKNCVNTPQHQLVKLSVPKSILQESILVSPDAGAYKKISKLDLPIPVIGSKIRQNGRIVDTEIFSNIDLYGSDCLIVDDICDGGRTFIELAKKLKEAGTNILRLYVTHGIFSKGFSELEKYFHTIYTTNTFKHTSLPEFVKVKCIL